jgi:hypothetical protein
MTVWHEGRRTTALMIGRALQTTVGWPTPYFLPEDRLNVVLYGPRFQSLDGSGWDSALVAIADELGRQAPVDFSQRCAEHDISFGEFVGAVVALPRGPRQSRRRWRPWR